jgi:hypothetical protein
VALEIPTIASEAATIEAELAGAVGGSIPAKSVLNVLATAVAGSIVSMYRFAGRRWLDMFARHASTDEVTILGRTFIPLVELGNMLGVGDPLPAVRAQLQLFVHVTDTSATLPAGTLLVGATNGVSYITKSALDLGVHETVTVIATEDPSGGRGYGAVGNLPYGSTLTFSAPMAGVSRDAMISGTLVSGSNGETWEAYRKRVHEARRIPPQGGSYADYRRWAKTVNGIEEAFPYTGAPGCVNIYVRATPESSGSEDGIPTTAQRTAVLAYINGTVDGVVARRPINDGVSVLPITRRTFDLEVHGLAITNSASASASIFAACDEHLRTREPFIVGLSALPRIDRVTNAELSGVVSQVVASLGGTITSVVLLADAEDVVARTLAPGEHAKLGEVTYHS